jgi:predicted nucleic acid-binding protein
LGVVVDASVAVKWFVPEEGHEAAFAVLQVRTPKWIPDFGLVEIVNVLRKKLRAGQIAARQIGEIIDTFPNLFASVVPTLDFIGDAWNIARMLDHPSYDCLYLACVERHGLELITADRRFFDKVRANPGGGSIRLLHSSNTLPHI